MEQPFISVIIPVYNVEAYVEKSIRSVMEQSYKNLEIFVIDDGSTDRSSEICARLAREDERIIFIQQENKGVVSARNAGIERATGEFMAFVDPDDWIEKEYYEKFIENVGDYDLLVCSSYYDHMMDGEKRLCWERFDRTDFSNAEGIQVLCQNLMWISEKKSITPFVWNKLFCADIVKRIYKKVNPGITYGEDVVFVYLYALRCKKVKIVDVSGYHHWTRENSAATRKYFSFLEDIQTVYNILYAEFEQQKERQALLAQLKQYMCQMLYIQLHVQDVIHTRYYFPWYGRLDGRKIILYGAGNVGQDFYRQIMEENTAHICLWCDKNYKTIKNMPIEISSPEKILSIPDYDMIIIAVYEKDVGEKIVEDLMKLGIPKDKIRWSKTKEVWELS